MTNLLITCASAWADAIGWAAFAIAACYIAWRFTGGKHIGEKR